jgi:hypothetical protein
VTGGLQAEVRDAMSQLENEVNETEPPAVPSPPPPAPPPNYTPPPVPPPDQENA